MISGKAGWAEGFKAVVRIADVDGLAEELEELNQCDEAEQTLWNGSTRVAISQRAGVHTL